MRFRVKCELEVAGRSFIFRCSALEEQCPYTITYTDLALKDGSSIVRYKRDSCHANSGTVNDLARQ